MRIGISNIAWDVAEDDEIAALLGKHAVDAIDIAPGKYFPELARAGAEEAGRLREWWAARGIEITGMQALLFGAAGLNLFGAPESRDAMLERLGEVARIAGLLGAPRLVFGSPRNRDRSGIDDAHARSAAIAFFRELGDRAAAHGVTFCLEANPARYGCNFMTTTAEAAQVVRDVAHAAIRLQLDSGTIAVNGEDPRAAVEAHAGIIGHVHASEPDLVPLGDGNAPHRAMAAALAARLPQSLVTVEMVATRDRPRMAAIEGALVVARREYGARTE